MTAGDCTYGLIETVVLKQHATVSESVQAEKLSVQSVAVGVI